MVKLYKTWNGREAHVYKDDEFPFVDYTSVSDVKKSLSPDDFATEENRRKKALASANNFRSKWFGMSVDEILSAWENMKEEGLSIGTKVHQVVERYLKTPQGGEFIGTEFECKVARSLIDVMRHFPAVPFEHVLCEFTVHMRICDDKGRTIVTYSRMETPALIDELMKSPHHAFSRKHLEGLPREELMVMVYNYLLTKGLAGTADIILVNEDATGFFIPDIKTDKEIKVRGYGGKTMKAPLRHLPACNLEEYQLQVEIYALMFGHMTSMDFLGGSILHWSRTDEVFSYYPAQRRREEIRRLLAYFFKIGPYVKKRV